MMITAIISLILIICCAISILKKSQYSSWTLCKTRKVLGIITIAIGVFEIITTVISISVLIGMATGFTSVLPNPYSMSDVEYIVSAIGLGIGTAAWVVFMVIDVIEILIAICAISVGAICFRKRKKIQNVRDNIIEIK